MKTSKELRAFTLGCLVVLHFFAFPVFARPRPPVPPLPAFAPMLSRFDFDDPYWQGTNTPLVETEYGQLIESWSGYALVRSGVMLTPFVISVIDSGQTNLAADSGAVRFWFKPYWSSASLTNGTGPGAEATLLDLVVVGDNDIITAWSLRFSADGAALILSDGATELLRADVAWPAGEWHCVALNYGPNETELFLDGEMIAKGEGVVSVPASSAGLVVGIGRYPYMRKQREQRVLSPLPLFAPVQNNSSPFASHYGGGPLTDWAGFARGRRDGSWRSG